MPSYDERTPRGWPLPFKSNTLEFDVERLRDALYQIDEALGKLETQTKVILDEKVAGVEERQYILDARMDVIAGQTTEDSEVLDARVDAKGVTHPNVGHNVRTLHSEVIEIDEALKYGIQEFRGLLRQFNELAYAQIQGDLNSQQAHERRKQELQQETQKRIEADDELHEELIREALTREEHDESLHEKTQKLSEATLQGSLNLHQEADQRRKDIRETRKLIDSESAERLQSLKEINDALSEETDSRKENEKEIHADIQILQSQAEALQIQAKDLSEANLRSAVNLKYISDREREALKQEIITRSEQDNVQQGQIDLLAEAGIQQNLNLLHETEQRRKLDEALRTETEIRTEHDEALCHELSAAENEIHTEEQIRYSQDEALQVQADEAAKAILNTANNLLELNGRRKSDLSFEEDARISGDELLQRNITELSHASLQDSLNLQRETDRRKTGDNEEVQARMIQGEVLQSEIDSLSTAVLQQNLNAHNEAERRRKLDETLKSEIADRIENNDDLRTAIDSETQLRINEDSALQAQVDDLSRGAIQDRFNELTLNAQRKTEIQQEVQSRTEQDKVQQRQIDSLSEASIQQSLNLHDEAQQRRKIAEDLTTESRTRGEDDESLRQSLTYEEYARNSDDTAQQGQIDSLAEASLKQCLNLHREILAREEVEATCAEDDANLQFEIDNLTEAALRDAINLSEEAARRESADIQEAKARTVQGELLQAQIDDLSNAGIRQDLNAQHENELRRAQFSQTHRQLDALQKQSDIHETEIYDLIEAMLRSSMNLHEALERRREDLKSELQTRANGDEVLQVQTDELADAVLRGAKNLRDALERWREAFTLEADTRIEQNNAQQSEIEKLSEASIQSSLNLHNAQSRIRTALNDEAQTSSEQASILQIQLEDNAHASILQSLNLAHETEKRRELSKVVADIKSPVDWSSSESLAINEPRCAVVNFTGLKSMPTSKTAEVSAIIEFWDMQGNFFRKKIICSAQGSSSLSYVKKNVKFDLLNEDGSEFNLKIGNWVIQDSFHLKAYYTDFFRGVGVTSYKLWDEIMETKPFKTALVDTAGMNPTANGTGNVSNLSLQIDTGALCHPDGFPCIVYLNGSFYGVFSWQIKKQRKNYHMDKSTVEHIHLDGTLSTANFWNGTINWTAFEIRNPNKLYTMDGKKYDGDAPRELIDETSAKYDPSDKNHVRSAKVKRYIQGLVKSFSVLKNLYMAYRSSPSEEMLAAVKAKYEEIFDVDNQRDYLIFSDVIKNSDGFAKNWQWITYNGIKWFVNAYDLDMSFGGHWQGIQITAPLNGHITTSTAIPTYYAALLYKTKLEARYKSLRDAGVIDVEHIVSKLSDWTARIGQSNYELEYERWPNSPCILRYNDSVDRVRKWLIAEIANMDRIYNYTPDDAAITKISNLEAADEFEAQIRASEDSALQIQVKDLAEVSLEDRFKFLALRTEYKEGIRDEAQIRHEENAIHDRQIEMLSRAGIRSVINFHRANEMRKAEILQEVLTRSENSRNLQTQIDDLAAAIIRVAVNDYEARARLREYLGDLYQAVADTGNLTYMGAGVASSREVSEMIKDVLSGSDAGEIPGTGIPEELQNRVATSSEVSEMLDETFPNRN